MLALVGVSADHLLNGDADAKANASLSHAEVIRKPPANHVLD